MRSRNRIAGLVLKDVLLACCLALLLLLISTFAQAQEIQAWGDNRWDQSNVPSGIKGILAISSGTGHATALKYDGTVSVWGLHGVSSVTEVIAIASGNLHTAALKSNGTVVAWGNNSYGQADIPPGLANVTAVASGNFHTLALKADGTVVAWGNNLQGQVNVPVGLTGVIKISAGYGHSVALKSNGIVVAWGTTAGTVPTTLSGVIAIDAGAYHNLALKSDGTVVAWGDNARGQCNVPAGLTGVIAVSAGQEHSVALKADGTVVAWGSNEFGQITIPPGLSGVVEISAGAWFTLVRKSIGTCLNVWASSNSILTSPPTFDISGIKAVAVGAAAGIVLYSNGTVKAWGFGNVATNLPTDLADVKAIAAGSGHGMALKADGTVISWGDNVPGGLTDVKAIAAGLFHSVALKSDGTVVKWGNANADTNFPSGLSDVSAIAAGAVHSIALKSNGTVAAWGSNNVGEATVPGGLANVVGIVGGNVFTLALKADGKVQGWGANYNGQLNLPSSPANGKAISAGNSHSFLLRSDGTLSTAGYNGNGPSAVPAGLNAVIAIDSHDSNNNVAIVFDQPPVIAGVATGMNYLEDASAMVLQPALTVTDNGNTSLAGGTISITSGFLSGDILSFGTVPPGISTTFDENTGVMTLTGTATVANYQSLLRSLTYHSTSQSPASNTTRTISISVNDGSQITTSSFTLNVIAVNDAPSFSFVTSSASGTFIEDVAPYSASGWAINISRGPADEAGQNLTFTTVNNNNGLFIIQPAFSVTTGSLSFRVTANVSGTAILTVRLTDNGGTANGGVNFIEKTFTITINPVNDAPSFTKGPDVVVNEDAGAQAIGNWATNLSRGPADEASQTLTFVLSNDNTTLFSSQPSLDAIGNLTFTSAPNAFGVAHVTVTLLDDGGTVSGGINSVTNNFTITVNGVNDAPSFNTISSLITDEDAQPVNMNWISGISPGPNEAGQTLTIEFANDNNSLFAVQPEISSSGRLSFTLAPNAFGTANVTVRFIDNGGTASGGVDRTEKSFSINVNAVNDAPSFTKGSDVVIPEDAGAQVVSNWATNMSPGPANESTQTVTFSIVNDNTTLFSAQPSLDAVGNLTFTPAPNTSGVATVTVTLTDNGGTAFGGSNRVSQTFTITINEVNDAPSFTTGTSVFAWEDTPPQTLNGWLVNPSPGPAAEAGQTLTVETENSNNSFFTVQPVVNLSGQLTFTLAPNVNGSVTIKIRLIDNGGTANGGIDRTEKSFSLTVQTVNDAPSFTKGSDVILNEDAGAQSINGWATNISPGPADEAAQTLTFSLTNNDNAGLFAMQPALNTAGHLTFTPAANISGVAHVTFTLTDNGGTLRGGSNNVSQTFTITINDVNDAPSFTKGSDVVIQEDAGAQAFNNWATNISPGPANEASQTLTFVVSNDNTSLFSSQPLLDVAGNLTFTVAPDAFGVANITVVLSDNGGTVSGGINSVTQNFTITIDGVNDAPSFTKGSDVVIHEDAGAQVVSNWATIISPGPANEAPQTLTFAASNDNTTLFSSQPSLNAMGNLTFTVAPDAFGVANITVVLSDNGGTVSGGINSVTQNFTITIDGVNDAPSFTKGSDVAIHEDAGVQVVSNWATNMSPGPPNEASQTLTFMVSNDNTSLFSSQPSLNATGNLMFTPAADAFGVANITVVLSDNGGTVFGGINSVTKNFTITIDAVNDAPSFTTGGAVVVNEDMAVQSFDGWLNNPSPGPANEAGQLLIVQTGNDHNSLFTQQPAIDLTGKLTFVLAPHANGSAVVTVRLIDNGGTANGGVDRSEQTFNFTIQSVNDAPTFTRGSDIVVDEDAGAQTVSGWATNISPGPADEALQTLTFSLSQNDNTGLFSVQPSLNASGTLTFTPAADRSGIANLTFMLNDNGGTARGGINSVSQSLTITIRAVNDAPSFVKGSDVVVNEDAGMQTIHGWATGISAGAGESVQILSFALTNSNNALFSVQPSMNASGDLTFTAQADAFGSATITVTLRDDGGTTNGGIDQRSQTFSVTVNSINDTPGFTKGANIVVHEDASAQAIGNWATGISPGPANEASQTLSFSVTNDNNSLFAIQPGIDASGGLTFMSAANAYGTSTITVRLTDNGGTANGGVNTTEKTFTITVDAVNDAPSFVKGANVMVNEDVTTQNIHGWATAISSGASNETLQTLTFVVDNDNTGLFDAQPSVDASGKLTFTPAANKFGVATISVTLTDDGGTANGGVNESAAQTFTITIDQVNDAPSFTKGNDIVVQEDAGEQNIDAWASGVSAGPQETDQTLTFSVSNNNNSLFSDQPHINGSGALVFTPALNKHGATTVTVSLRDNGGTSHGGVDQAGDQTFVITITEVNDAPLFVKGNDVIVIEDSPAQIIPGWATQISAGPPDESAQSLTFIVSSDNNNLFSVQPLLDASGNLTFTPAANAYGTTLVTVTLKDNGGTANGGSNEHVETFTVTIENTNEAPSFTSGTDIAILEDAPAYSAVWAINISAGTGEESQKLTFIITVSRPTLFIDQPSLNSSGILSFKVAPDAFGSSTVSVVLADNGGTSRGGMDRTPISTFVINILPVNDAPEIDHIDNIIVDASRESIAVSLTGIGPQEEGQSITIETVSDAASLVTASEVLYTGGSAATLILTPSKEQAGTATITVRVRDDGGVLHGGDDETMITFTVTIEENIQEVFVPTLFTPNANGTNDVFRVRANGVAAIQFKVYDAYGLEVFSANDVTTVLETGWDGKHRGKELPAGTYTWTLTGKYRDGRSLTGSANRYGQVVLLR
jgi:gliding motility-associated-like protein